MNILFNKTIYLFCGKQIQILLNYDILVNYIFILTSFTFYLNLTEGLSLAECNGVFYVQMHLVGISGPSLRELKVKEAVML